MEGSVSASNNLQATDRTVDILEHARERGVQLWAQSGQLHYKAPKGALTEEEIERLRAHKAELTALLERVAGIEPEIEVRSKYNRAPLAYSQLAHWHLHKLGERRVFRAVSIVHRLKGRINLDALQKGIAEVVRRHEALRTRIVVCDGVPMQEVVPRIECIVSVYDLTNLPDDAREMEGRRLIYQYLYEKIDVTVDPLFVARLLRIRDDENVLVATMDHLIADGFSRNIILREILQVYTQASRGDFFSLPEIPVQLIDYASWQRTTQVSWIERHDVYWNRRVSGCQRVRFPEDKSVAAASLPGLSSLWIEIDADLTAELRQWCRLRRTTLVMCVFSAYVAFVLRCCGVREAVFLYQTDGRFSSKVQNTVGYLAFRLYLRLGLLAEDSFVDLIKNVTEEYCSAHEHADFGRMEAKESRPEFTKNTCFNWVSRDLDHFDLEGIDGSLSGSAVLPEDGTYQVEIDAEPALGLCDFGEKIEGILQFPADRFSTNTMVSFWHDFLVFIRVLLRQPERRVTDIP